MQRQAWRMVATAIAVAMVAFVGCLLLVAPQPPEPEYASHPSSYWIGQLGSDQASEAMRALDTNAVPALVRALLPPPGGIRGMYRSARPKLPRAIQRILPAPAPWPQFPDDTKILAIEELKKLRARNTSVLAALDVVAGDANLSATLRTAAAEALADLGATAKTRAAAK
jgi:hypothetical protein